MGAQIPNNSLSDTNERSEQYVESLSLFNSEHELTAAHERELFERVWAIGFAKRRLQDRGLRLQERLDLLQFVRMGRVARDELIRANMGYVLATALHYQGGKMPIEALIQEGNLGLLLAVDSYRLNSDARFANHAKAHIKTAIEKAMTVAENSQEVM